MGAVQNDVATIIRLQFSITSYTSLTMYASRLAWRSLRQTIRLKPFKPRFASYQRFGQKPQYSNFGPFARVQYIWRNYQTPILITGAGGGTFYVLNLEEVPVSHRRRFNCISPELEKKLLAGQGYEEILQEFRGKFLPDHHPYTQMVARVVQRLLPAAEGLAGDEFVIHVIDDPRQQNAFVMPGGKVFVFTGILPICEDENGLATVLGHEIAHNIAHHVSERISRSVYLVPLIFFTAFLFDISGQLSSTIVDLFLGLPNGRVQESEADHIGLFLMAASCYDPSAAVGFWERMKKAEKGAPPQFLSTHPSSYNRIHAIQQWLPEAQRRFADSGCSTTSLYMNDFKNALSRSPMDQVSTNDDFSTLRSNQTSGKDDDFF